MAFVDELHIHAKAGDGGDGVVRWLHLKGKEYSGPAGGNGGDGGDIYVRAHSDISLLGSYRGAKEFRAQNGEAGGSRGMEGKRGEDLYIDVPRGSIVINEATGEHFELLREGESVLALKGGRGGAGNKVFKSSVNRTPTEATSGGRGEEADLRIELRLIADAGLVGLPNAGKTTLLNALTGASGKVGAYSFTTLEPNLGALWGYVIADIPGLIEGASQGRGLGTKFLRHISRTALLLHCLSLESHDLFADYDVVRRELAQRHEGLEAKPEAIILTKSDMVAPEVALRIRKEFEGRGKQVRSVSVLDDASVAELKEFVAELLKGRQ